MNQIIVVFLVAAVAIAQGTIVEPCGGTAKLNGVDVQGCADSVNGRCQFVKGQSYKIEVDAEAAATATALPYTAKAKILGLDITLFEGNACEFLTAGDCPALSGERVVFEKEITITNTYPALQSVLKVEVKDESAALLLCANIQFAIVNA